MPTPEAEILKPADPSITDSDDWETFVLHDARVVYESNGKLANLLSAYADTPLRVEGRLEAPDRTQAKCLVKKPYKPTDIVVSNVTRFSYGEMADGEHCIWAMGAAGWFEIEPAPQYQAIYNDMMQAVELLYFITDIYSEPRKKGGGPTAKLIYQEYAEDERFSCIDAAAAEAIFHKHREFLIMCFVTRAQGVGWSNTPIYPTYKQQFPEIFESCLARLGRKHQAQTERPTKPIKPPVPTAKSISSKPKTNAIKGGEPPKKDNNWWEAAALFEFIQRAVNQRVLRAGRNRITLERVAQLVTRRYEIDEIETAQNVLLVHAQNLCYMMDHPRRQDIRFFVNEPIYQELAGHNLSAATQRRAEGVELRLRKRDRTLKDGESESSNTSDEEEAISTPVRHAPSRRKLGRLSALRPKSSKYSGKSKSIKSGKSKSKPPLGSSDIDSEADTSTDAATDAEEADITSDEMVLGAPTGTSPRREKRKLDATVDTEGEPRTRQKRAVSSSPVPSSSSLSADTAAALPLHDSDSVGGSMGLTATLASTPLPTYTANGPRDSWVCSVDGCTQRIYGCSKSVGRRLITEHLEDHSQGREKVVGILWGERERLRLPVDNLIKRIREMSSATTSLFPAEGVVDAL